MLIFPFPVAKIILPNSTIGVFGSGQLGRMFAIEARKMGYRVHTFSPYTGTPTGQVADIETCAQYEDLDAVKEFAKSVDVVTFEFENVPAASAAFLASHTKVRPSWKALEVCQDRIKEKQFFGDLDFTCHEVRSFGYPYPMHAAHRSASLTKQERKALKDILVQHAQKEGLLRGSVMSDPEELHMAGM